MFNASSPSAGLDPAYVPDKRFVYNVEGLQCGEDCCLPVKDSFMTGDTRHTWLQLSLLAVPRKPRPKFCTVLQLEARARSNCIMVEKLCHQE